MRNRRPSTSRKPAPSRVVVAALGLVAAGWFAYATSFAGVFVFDDVPAIVENGHIRTLWPLTEAAAAPPEVTVSGRPVAALTLALNYALAPADARDVMAPDATDRFARNVWGYHAVNLAIHLAAALALFGVARRTLLAPALRDRCGHAATALAFTIALLWVVHPIQTEAVTYIVQRVESLMGLFYLLTLYCALRAADGGAKWTIGAIVACALGMATKETMVTAPLMVALWDWVFLEPSRLRSHSDPASSREARHGGGAATAARYTLYIGLAATWGVLAALVRHEARPQSVGLALGWTWWSYLITQAGVVAHYLRLAIVPSPLVFDYGWPKTESLAAVAPQAILLVALLTATLVALARRWPSGWLGAWVFLILAPTSSVLPIVTEVAAEHRMYLPVAAAIALGVLGSYRFVRGRAIRTRVALVGVAAVAMAFAVATRARNQDYWSDEALWLDTVQKRPANARAHVGYAIDLLSSRRFADAERELRQAVALEEVNGRAHMNLGAALCAQGHLDEGIAHLERARALDPRLKETDGLLGEAYSQQGKPALALASFDRALERLPDNAFLLRRVAWMLATTPEDSLRNGRRAAQLAERAVRLTNRQDVVALDALAAAYAEEDRFGDAAAAVAEARALSRTERNEAYVAELDQRAALYRAGRKLRSR